MENTDLVVLMNKTIAVKKMKKSLSKAVQLPDA